MTDLKEKRVRLSEEEIKAIKETAKEIFGEKTKVYLFGSRTDIHKKGGDIDILIVPKEKKDLFKKKIKLSSKLENILGKPVDVIVSRDKNKPIEREALKGVKI
ncbi:MAG TPA: nucleotidyltransferase domain-containing protein [Persephonella sp.]|uniref:DNA polymerase, beta domain protein region n=1 Tax=Persephonella marina (strain DSM 14350 / EX-H1) TaxID=123214 RepID=C0QSU2_PERMH|nr:MULTISPECIES: nucleotidyltransferase domain-containing protein [Persephonella]ACO03481.1 DNA polymerase, beta domain protein region [Persephonella marina EX-H1]HCB70623.1 nucleotidyltransferase domain-containing protein [Persephonella sp.]